MVQFGAGTALAAQCPNVPAPDGWRPWTDAEGPIPEALEKRAAAFIADVSIPLGSTESYPLPGVTTLIRIEPRVWSRDASGNLVQGCFRSGGIYLPDNGAMAPSQEKDGGWGKAIAVLTVASLAVGTAATLYSWGKQ
jgi:hypothetical protein